MVHSITACLLTLVTLFGPASANGRAPKAVSLPEIGEKYPELQLQDHRGRTIRLSSLRGKIILIEPIGMT